MTCNPMRAGGKVVDGDGNTVVSGSGDVTVTVTGSY